MCSHNVNMDIDTDKAISGPGCEPFGHEGAADGGKSGLK